LDTFLTLPTWTKGVAYINGNNLGRYWNVGAQRFLYVPATWLTQGSNELIVFELEGFTKPIIEFSSTPWYMSN
jgi:beta-galactosidase